VPWGVSTRTRTETAPFYKIKGNLRINGTNSLIVEAANAHIRVKLNGVETIFPGLSNLGFGETGFSVYEKSVTLQRVHVASLTSLAKRDYLIPVWGFLLPLGFMVLLKLLLSPFAKVDWLEISRIVIAALFLPAVYLFFALMLKSDELAYFGAHRIAWLDMALIGLCLSLFHLFPMLKSRLKAGALLSNVLLLSLFSCIALFIWDGVLPADHPLRVRFEKDVIAPAEAIGDNREISSLWYSNNRLAVANTYPWHHQFGGRSINVPKPGDTVRIFAMGGSQAWGSGAASTSATYDSLIENRLVSNGYTVEAYNAGVNGAGISRIYATFRDLVLPFQPDLLILNLGLNDSASLRKVRTKESKQRHRNHLIEHYGEIVKLCLKHDVQLLLVQEAINKESPLRKDEQLYEAIADVTTKAGFPVIDAYALLREKQLDHMFWWDTAHFTPAGQEALADLLTPVIEKMIM
jgi:lysophospholipase L1-like esterase